MRISDWSSDVCSSDLRCRACRASTTLPTAHTTQKPAPAPAISTLPSIILKAERPRHIIQTTAHCAVHEDRQQGRSEEHTSELQSLMRISYAVFCLKQKKLNLSHKY